MAKRTVGVLYVPERFVQSRYLQHLLKLTIESFS